MTISLIPPQLDPTRERRRQVTERLMQEAVDRLASGGDYRTCTAILGTLGPAWEREDSQQEVKIFP